MKKILGLLCMATLMLSSIHNANAAPRNNIQYPKGIWLYQSQDGGVYTSDWYAYPLTKNGNNLEINLAIMRRVTTICNRPQHRKRGIFFVVDGVDIVHDDQKIQWFHLVSLLVCLFNFINCSFCY